MAKPQSSHPEDATLGGSTDETDAGQKALEDALGKHGEELAAAIEATDELDDLLVTAILIIASADEEEVENVTESLAALVEAGDGLLTEETAELAGMLGENADELADALDLLLELQRSGDLETLLETARMLTVLDIDEETADGLNRLLSAVGAAERTATDAPEDTGLLATVRGFTSTEARQGLRYLLGLLRGLGTGPDGK